MFRGVYPVYSRPIRATCSGGQSAKWAPLAAWPCTERGAQRRPRSTCTVRRLHVQVDFRVWTTVSHMPGAVDLVPDRKLWREQETPEKTMPFVSEAQRLYFNFICGKLENRAWMLTSGPGQLARETARALAGSVPAPVPFHASQRTGYLPQTQSSRGSTLGERFP